KRIAVGPSALIGDRNGDQGSAELIGRRQEGDGAARSAAAKKDIRVRHQVLIGGMAYDRHAARGGIHVADGEWDGGRGPVFVDRLAGDAGDGPESQNVVQSDGAGRFTHAVHSNDVHGV